MRKLAIASVAVAALVLPAAAETTAPASAKQPLYVLGPGTRLVYHTSATLTVTGPQPVTQSVECKGSFTVLAASDKSRTVFAALERGLESEQLPIVLEILKMFGHEPHDPQI